MTDEVLRFYAAWLLTHEMADEGLKAAVRRGQEAQTAGEGMSGGPDAFVEGMAAMIAEEKERLKAELAAGGAKPPAADETHVALEELRFEVAELRGRIDELASMLETVLARTAPDVGRG